VIDPRSTAILHGLFRRESRSFLQYLGDSLPWPGGNEVQTALGPIVEEERAALADVALFLDRNHVPLPYVGSYPTAFTTRNFVSLQNLVPSLIEEERRSIGVIERELAELNDAEAREIVRKLFDIKRRHLRLLEDRTTSSTEAVAAVH
jgi:hypothetical protein